MSTRQAKKIRKQAKKHLQEQHSKILAAVQGAIVQQLNEAVKKAAFPAKTKASKLVLPWYLRLKISLGLVKQEEIPTSKYKVKIINKTVQVVPVKTVQGIVVRAVKQYTQK